MIENNNKFKFDMQLNYWLNYCKTIPLQGEFALLSHMERNILHDLILQLDDNSIIIEIGSALGGSACILAAANPTNNIICIEPFHNNIWSWKNQVKPYLDRHIMTWCDLHNTSVENQLSWISVIDSCFEEDPLGISAFHAITKDFPNIKLIRGESPYICADWSQPIDVYFEDAMHENPLLHENINFWSRHIKPNGFIVGHDYDDRCPDVIKEFNKLIEKGWSVISKVQSLIILQKPNLIEGNT